MFLSPVPNAAVPTELSNYPDCTATTNILISSYCVYSWHSDKQLFLKWKNTTHGDLQFVRWCVWRKRQRYSYKALIRNNFRGYFEDIKTSKEHCVAGDAKSFYCRWTFSSNYLNFEYIFTVSHGQLRLLHQCQLCAHILTVEVKYRETSLTSFVAFRISIHILWKNSSNFHVFTLPSYYSSFGNNVNGRPLPKIFPSITALFCLMMVNMYDRNGW
jgi:hypothetical protein